MSETAETKILNYLGEHIADPQKTLVLAKLIYGDDARKKMINPTLYAMERKRLVTVIKNANGRDPRWILFRHEEGNNGV